MKRSPWDKVEDNSVYQGRSTKLEGKSHKDIMKTTFRTFGDTWIETAIRERMKKHVAMALDLRDDKGRIAPHLVDLKSEFLDTLKGIKMDIEYRFLTMDDLRKMVSYPIDVEFWRERVICVMQGNLAGQNRPMPRWWLDGLTQHNIQHDRALRGVVIRECVPYQETGVTRVPGLVWRWDTIGAIVKHQRSKDSKTFHGHKDDVRSSDDVKTPPYTDMICCKKCGRVFYIPTKGTVIDGREVDEYPGGTLCYQCDPWVFGIVGWKPDGSGPIMVPMRLAEYKVREDNVGKPKGKRKKVSVAYRTGSDKMVAAIERMNKILAAGGKRVDVDPIMLDDYDFKPKPTKRSNKKSKMDEAIERLARIVGKKRV